MDNLIISLTDEFRVLLLYHQYPQKEGNQIVEDKVAEAEGHDRTETKQDANQNTLRSVVVTRMMTEGAVSAVKVPVLLALASMYFQGIVY
jgi:hypothetical protein